MNRLQKSLLLVLGIAIPAAAHSALSPKESACFTSGTATYRIEPAATAPDFRIRIDREARRPDLRMRLVDRPEVADFVLTSSSERSAMINRVRLLDAAVATNPCVELQQRAQLCRRDTCTRNLPAVPSSISRALP